MTRRTALKTLAAASSAAVAAAPAARAAAADRTWAERLGWRAGEVVGIFHVDDVGMHHAANRGAIASHEQGVGNSWALMMPCPWVPEIVKYLRAHPEVDAGLHLTLNSEWVPYRWGPVAGAAAVPGLVGDGGGLWRSVPQGIQKASADEVEREIRAQLARAERLGLPVTHLDSHMGALFARPDYFERWLRVATEKRLPLLAPGGHRTHVSRSHPDASQALPAVVQQVWDAGLPVIDDLHTGAYEGPPEARTEWLLKVLAELKPGITEILFHSSIPTDDFPLVTHSHAARLSDTRALTDPRVRQLLADRGIQRTTWRELMERRRQAG